MFQIIVHATSFTPQLSDETPKLFKHHNIVFAEDLSYFMWGEVVLESPF